MASDSGQTASANAAQAEYWNSAPAQTWIDCQAALDQRFAPLTELLIGRAGVRPGECVIDVGCGTGTTTLQLAAGVGAHGSVLAIDISEPLLALARRRCLEAGHANVRLIRGDAQTHRFERGCHDLVVSRFGVMFFDDPIGAFRNLAGALRPRGRLAFACWGPLEANPWFALPLQVGIERLGPPEPQPPRAPGPACAQRAGLRRRDPERGRIRRCPDRTDRDLAARRPERARGSRAGGAGRSAGAAAP